MKQHQGWHPIAGATASSGTAFHAEQTVVSLFQYTELHSRQEWFRVYVKENRPTICRRGKEEGPTTRQLSAESRGDHREAIQRALERASLAGLYMPCVLEALSLCEAEATDTLLGLDAAKDQSPP